MELLPLGCGGSQGQEAKLPVLCSTLVMLFIHRITELFGLEETFKVIESSC